jgi:cytoskeletal protein CcmA (bactofilin family)
MTCPTELILSRCADGALPRQEAEEVERHLTGCADCRGRVEELANETRALRAAMQAAEAAGYIPAFVPRPTIPRMLSWFAWMALAAWVVNMAWTSLAASAALPGWLGWLGPDALGMSIDLVISLVSGGGGEVLGGLIQAAEIVALTGIAVTGLWLVLRSRINRGATLCLQLCLVSALATIAPTGHAIELRRDDDRVAVRADETIDDTLIVASNEVLIEGTITGDLIIAGEDVTVRGRVGGSLVAAAETLNIEGEVTGSVFGAAETLNVRGASLAANLFGAGETLTVDPDASLAGNLVLAAEQAGVQGSVGRDVLGVAEKLSLLGTVKGDLKAYGQTVDLAASARVGGDLTAKVLTPDHLKIAEGATVEGKTDLSTWPKQPSKYVTPNYYLRETLKFLAAFVTGLALFYLFPALRETRLATGNEVAIAVAIGAVTLVAAPILAVMATVTLIGAPLGILVLLLWIVGLYLSGIIAAGYLGRLLLDGEAHGRVIPLLAGLVILFVLINVPILGGVVRLVALIVGLGLIAQWLRGAWASRAT